MKLCWSLLIVAVALPMLASATNAESDLWEEDDKEVLVRTARGTKDRASGGSGADSPPCRYTKGPWSECDHRANTRTRTLTLKKGVDKSCEQIKTVSKTCQDKKVKACRYEKGTWSSCVNHQNTTRIDNLKANSDPSCEKTRRMTKKCKLHETRNKKATKDRSNKKASKSQ